ncbi:MAG: hydroxyacylglutathione hydrolase [Alphaproteobacteria bacterium]
MFYIYIIPQLKDNYSYILRDNIHNITCVVDPSASEPIEKFLIEKKWRLDYILNTHHHFDHIGGNEVLKQNYNAKIIASDYDACRIDDVDIPVNDEQIIEFPSLCKILHIPGHTLGHIAYYFPLEEALFCGDTLFSLGCGRLFEGTAEQMYNSLKKLSSLPSNTKIYPGHEYTLKNCEFALSIDDQNQNLFDFYKTLQNKRAKNQPTIPSTLEIELQFNPFLRTENMQIKAKLNLVNSDSLNIFTRLRELKDKF